MNQDENDYDDTVDQDGEGCDDFEAYEGEENEDDEWDEENEEESSELDNVDDFDEYDADSPVIYQEVSVKNAYMDVISTIVFTLSLLCIAIGLVLFYRDFVSQSIQLQSSASSCSTTSPNRYPNDKLLFQTYLLSLKSSVSTAFVNEYNSYANSLKSIDLFQQFSFSSIGLFPFSSYLSSKLMIKQFELPPIVIPSTTSTAVLNMTIIDLAAYCDAKSAVFNECRIENTFSTDFNTSIINDVIDARNPVKFVNSNQIKSWKSLKWSLYDDIVRYIGYLDQVLVLPSNYDPVNHETVSDGAISTTQFTFLATLSNDEGDTLPYSHLQPSQGIQNLPFHQFISNASLSNKRAEENKVSSNYLSTRYFFSGNYRIIEDLAYVSP